MIKRIITLAICGGFVCLTPAVHAALTIDPSVGGHPFSGVNYVTFNTLPLGGGGGFAPNTAASADPLGGITVSFTPDAQVVNGPAAGLYAPPVLSNGNGANFDGQADGVDTTNYITSGKDGSPNIGAKAELTFSSHQNYFGLLWGSVDEYNTLEFFDGLTSVGTIIGTQITPAATGDQGIDGTFYVNITSDLLFDRVVATSSEYAFEFDNVAYGIPEATTIVVWSCLSLIGLFAYRRRYSM